ncbi:MAG: dihydrofolate reductase [Bacteroidales bacterium]|nr:dihydrofolate reductase [Candidatus Cacconaster merdequi]
MSTLSLICAAADNLAIGSGGSIPWHIAEDFKYFKRVTMGHTIIMGRATWDSIGAKALPGRRNIVVSRSCSGKPKEDVEFFSNLEDALAASENDGEVFIIGGGTLYRQTIDRADRIYLTKVHTVIDSADTFFPAIDPGKWREISHGDILCDEKSNLKFEFLTYERFI